jgi:hypothetical protein
MTQRRILFLDANRLTSHAWSGGSMRPSREFTADSNGLEAFGEYLSRHTNTVFTILVDVTEEGFQLEDVPYVSGKDRNALTSRRLSQYFYGTPYSMAISLGRETAGRRDEKILFAAITQPRHIDPWLEAMRQASSQLAGVYSAPQALASLLSSPGKTKGPQLVLSMTRSGVRQTFFSNGKLQFSRLTVLATGSQEEAAIACAVEAEKIYQYLTGQRMLPHNAPLKIQVLAHPGQFGTIRAHCRSSAELNFEYLDLLLEAKKSRLKTEPTDSRCELLLLHEVARRPPAVQFAPPAERHFFRLWQIRFGLTAAAALVFSSCLIYAGKQYYSTHSLNQDTQELQADARADQARYEAELKALPQLPISTEDVRELVNRFEELARRSPLLETTLIPLSRALDATPGIEIQRIDWKLSDKLPVSTAQVSGAYKQPPLTVSGSYFVVAEVDAQLPVALLNDHRAMLELINRFATELAKEQSLGLQMMQLPFDVESGKTIKSSADTPVSQAEAPKFAFRLIQGL